MCGDEDESEVASVSSKDTEIASNPSTGLVLYFLSNKYFMVPQFVMCVQSLNILICI